MKLNDYLFVTLTDHLNFAIKAYDNKQINPNLIMWEIKRYYPKEFQLGLKAIDYIEDETGKRLNEFEAGHIALHLINAQINKLSDVGNNSVVKITKRIDDIMNIIKYSFNIDLDISTFEYERLVYHLKFFLTRIDRQKKPANPANKFLLKEVIIKFPKEFECVCKIEKYLESKLNDDEYLYLTMHIARVVNVVK
jgi:beta-glucoside operon transcriptional antiterminator